MKTLPSVGRVVWYRPHTLDMKLPAHTQPFAASVAHVNEDGTVNLSIINERGQQFFRENVTMIIEDEQRAEAGQAEWMPYQKAQAIKHATDPVIEAASDATVKASTPSGLLPPAPWEETPQQPTA